jgi:hypothetical protein
LYKTGKKIIFLLLFTLIAGFQWANAQFVKMPDKKDEKSKDTVKTVIDSSRMKKTTHDPVTYKAQDSLVYDFGDEDTITYLYKKASAKSLDMDISAGYLEASKKTGMVLGYGYPDTTGKTLERPVFKQGREEMEMDTVWYNYVSKKARIKNIRTKQGDGLLYGEVSKRMPDNSTFIKNAQYTTCDNPDDPHFYIMLTRGKVVDKPSRYIYFGPSYLVIEDVPFPLIIPFGFFPQQSKRASGIKMPTWGEEVSRGFFLRDIGYHFAIGQHLDIDLYADYYTLGSWATRATSSYNKRYKYTGSFDFNYAFNTTGDKGSSDYNAATTFSVRWSHRMSPKARPGTTFSANVNFSSANNNLYVNNASHNPYENINNTISSSISYARTWRDTPFNMSVNATHSQNMRDSTYAVTFPNLTFTMSRIYPFKRTERVGKKALYEDISLTYSATFDNRINFKSTEIKEPNFFKKMVNGVKHNISLGLPNFTLLKYFNLSPSVRYGAKWYFNSREKHWDEDLRRVITDTTQMFSRFGMVQEYGFSASLNTQIYGIVNFKKGGLVEAVRHVVKPSISFSYNPDLRKPFNGYRTVQCDTLGNMEEYNIYQGQPYGYPTQGKSGSINFSIGNNLEMKVRSNTGDSVSVKKVPLLNTFTVSGSYNFLADSMRLSNISFSGTTNLPGSTALSFRFTLDPYAINERGVRTKDYVWQKDFSLGRLTNFGLSFGYSFSGGKSSKGKDSKGSNDRNRQSARGGDDDEHSDLHNPNVPLMAFSPFRYEPFSVPWSLSFNYSYNYTKTYSYTNGTLFTKHNHNQTLGFNGNFSPTSNWDISVSSGWDFKAMDLTMTQISINRKLHCFSFSFNWTPLGRYQSWSFKIGILSSMLSDVIKYDKQSSYWDN